ncbi:hypothetical protein OG2516_08983 [Oceanicola granulosus HTCC2516]|uniref:Uncharacterized protein n=1 Tax=Oceanicola granulosus (strain ATCC BAA-861 / DSM 15982 / KCTC 12143 / HTCC2516) TaxID=314256 RepID=Q2CCQ3_OCEGH|nr:hypothetical protein [Oceanicola granulosus]EAR50460.1 hypothetical protein OG2516_08983 [Oceanicola granulosus HTCC2516]
MLIDAVVIGLSLLGLAFFATGWLPAGRTAEPAPPPAPVAPLLEPAAAEPWEPQEDDGDAEVRDHEPEIIDMRDPDDVITLDFPERPAHHLHLVSGSACAEIDAGTARSAWIDVYLSRLAHLGEAQLDGDGEYAPGKAAHVIRIDLGSQITAPDGTVTGAVNDEPEIFFDRVVASQVAYAI